MIIGNGDIANVLPDKEDFIFFASGVSNSKENRESEYKREEQLLMQQDFSKHLVYFSSLCVFYSNSRYAQHKLAMEKIVRTYFVRWTIIRLGNITWGNNPHTLINYLKAHPSAEIEDVERYIADKDEFLHWINLIPKWSCEMNITGRRMKVEEIVKEYVQ